MFKNLLTAAALTAVAFAAQAGVTGGVASNQDPTSFIALSASNVSGGALYTANALPNAAIPMDTSTSKYTVGTWLAAGPGNGTGSDAVVSFGAGTSFVSFLWGSPDTYNTLTVNTTGGGTFDFTSSSPSLAGIVFAGNQDFASYVGFAGTGGALITSLVFHSTSNAFEASNFSITPVPEPETYALLLAGLGVVGFMARRRRSV